MLKLMEQIAFEITKKFNASFTYKHIGEEIGFYSFSNEPHAGIFNLYITPDSAKVEVHLFRFDPCATTSYIEIEKRRIQNFLHNMLYLLEVSDTWGDFVKKLYCLNELSD